MGLLKGAVRGTTTNGRSKNEDKDFLERLAAMFSQSTAVMQKDVIAVTGLSKTRLRAARRNPTKKAMKKRSDSRTPEDVKMMTDWVINTARRSADKSNTAHHPVMGPHHTFHRTWSEAEGYQPFKEQCPSFKHKKTTFDEHVRSLHWLKKPRSHDCLCVVCTNMQLMLRGLRTHQKGLGVDDDGLVQTNRFSFLKLISCAPPNPAPVGQEGFLHGDCATNDCDACKDGGTCPVRMMKPVLDFGDDDDPVKHLKWKKVERKNDDGSISHPVEKVQMKSKPDAFAADFLKELIGFREHFHEWQFQAASERIMRCELLNKKEPHTFHHFYDLSENYTLTYKAAPQSTHWGSVQVTSIIANEHVSMQIVN